MVFYRASKIGYSYIFVYPYNIATAIESGPQITHINHRLQVPLHSNASVTSID